MNSRVKNTVSWQDCQLAPVVFIEAKEAVLAERAMARLRELAVDQDSNVERTKLDAATYEAGQLTIHTSPSLFGEQRIVEINELEKSNDALLTDLLTYIQTPEDSAWVVLRHNGGQRGRKLITALKNTGFPHVLCPEVKSVSDKIALVKADAKRAKRRLTNDGARALVEALGSDVAELTSGLAQLMSDKKGTIDVETVNTYYSGKIEADGFRVADAAIAGREAEALTLARHAFETGTDPLRILSALMFKLRQLAKAGGAASRGGAKAIGMQQWQLRNAQRDLRNWSEVGLAYAITAVVQADAEVKGESRDPLYATERAIRRVCMCAGR